MKALIHLIAIACVSAPTLAQQQPSVPQVHIPVIKSSANLVLVPTIVRTADGELVTGLTEKDFLLTDNQIEQKLSVEQVEQQPLAIVILMQTGGSAPRQFQNYRTFNTLLSSMTGSSACKVALITFDSKPEQIWNFPPRVDGIKHAFANPEDGDKGAALLDALNYGIGLLQPQPKNLRRIILLLSQPQDNGSKISEKEVLQRLGTSNATIYSVTFPPESTATKHLATQPAPNPVTSIEFALQALHRDTAAEASALTGGERLRLRNKDDLQRTVSVLTNHFLNTYTLSFHPDSKQSGFHLLKVQTTGKHSHQPVAARSSYWIDDALEDRTDPSTN